MTFFSSKKKKSKEKKMIAAQAHAGSFGKDSKGQRSRRKKRDKKVKEAEKQNESTVKPGSETEHLVVQTELSEGSHRSLTNFAESQDKVTPTKPPPHVV